MKALTISILAAFAVVLSGSTTALGAAVKGEPVYHGAGAGAPQVARLRPSQLALIRVGARTGEVAVVRQAFGRRPHPLGHPRDASRWSSRSVRAAAMTAFAGAVLALGSLLVRAVRRRAPHGSTATSSS